MRRRDVLRSMFFGTSTTKSLINNAVPVKEKTEELKAVTPNSFKSNWHLLPHGEWTAEDLCRQSVRDWCIKNGELNCVTHGVDRMVHVLTHQLCAGDNSFKATFIFRFLNQPDPEDDIENFAGFRLGVNVMLRDYNSLRLKDNSIDVGITRNGCLFIGKTLSAKKIDEKILTEKIRLQLSVTALSTGGSFAKLRALDNPGNTIATLSGAAWDAAVWQGDIALMSNCKATKENTDQPTIAISKFEIEGEKIILLKKRDSTSMLYS